MGDLAPGQCRLEIFRQPVVFDDSFAKGWTLTTGGSSVFQSDGEIAILDAGDQSYCDIEKSFPAVAIAVPVDWRVIARTTLVQGSLEVHVWDTVQSLWVKVLTVTSPGLSQSSMTAVPAGNTISKIKVRAVGQYNMEQIDYVTICKATMQVPDQGDVVDELNVTMSLWNVGVNRAAFLLQNFGGAYNGVFSHGDVVLIYLARDIANLGNYAYKVFGGRINDFANKDTRFGDFYVYVECLGHDLELIAPPSQLQKDYASVNGRAIIEDALALCTYITRHPDNHHWFDSAGAGGYGSTNDWIDSVHTVKYDEEELLTVVQEILEKAKNPSALQGFDAYCEPSGVAVGHLRNSLDFVSAIAAVTPQNIINDRDLQAVRNNVKVYGAKDKLLPQDESWTESTTGWTTDQGSLATDTNRLKGSYSLKGTTSASVVAFHRTFSAVSCDAKYRSSYRKLEFSLYFSPDYIQSTSVVRLYAPDSSNYFEQRLAEPMLAGNWYDISTDVGPAFESAFYVKGFWTKTGNPDWANVQGIYFYLLRTIGEGYFLVDNLRFSGMHFNGSASDAASQSLYGTRRMVEVDEALMSDAECQAKAESILAVRKNPLVSLSDVVVDGDHRFRPGERQRVVVSNDGLDSYYPIRSVRHTLAGSQWDSGLVLNADPQYIDYFFILLSKKNVLLGRRGTRLL